MSDTFKFDGLPSNDFVEVPDTPKKRRSTNPQMDALDRLTPDDLKNIIPESLLDELADEAKQYGVNVDDLINKAIGSAKDIVSGKSGSLDNLLDGISIRISIDGQDDNLPETEEDAEDLPYELGKLEYFRPEEYGSIPMVKDENLYQHFVERYGSDGSKYLDDNGIENIYLNASTSKVPVEDIEKLVVAEYNDEYIIFYAQPKDPSKYGFFVSVVENPDGKFTLFIPEFRNTYKVLPDGSITLFDLLQDKEYFRLGMDGKAEFLGYDINMIELSTAYMIYENKLKCLITPKEFGTIKNCKAIITEDSNYLQIGTIKSNECDKAILLKKDAELPLSKTEFPIYAKFGEEKLPKEMLQDLSDVFFKVNFNECKYFDNCELKYNTLHELYVDIN